MPHTPIVLADGRTYPSKKAFAAAFGLTQGIVHYRMGRLGQSADEVAAVPRQRRRKFAPIQYKGVEYRTIKAFADAVGVSYSLASNRLRRGWTPHRIATVPAMLRRDSAVAQTRCKHCEAELEESEAYWCKSCQANYHRVRTFGPEARKYLDVPSCEVCGLEFNAHDNKRKLHLDHDHVTGAPRGALCKQCNMGLGNFRDDVHMLEAAIRYLKR